MAKYTIAGRTINLGELYGKKAVYLKFWATVRACIKQMPHFEQTFQQAGPELAIIAINAGFNDMPAEVREVRQKHAITMPIVIDDGQLGEPFNLRVTPQHVIIGRDGRIQYVVPSRMRHWKRRSSRRERRHRPPKHLRAQRKR